MKTSDKDFTILRFNYTFRAGRRYFT